MLHVFLTKLKLKPKQTPNFHRRIQEWAKEISNILYENENITVRRDVLLKGFTDVKIETRNGTAIVEKAARALEELLERRGRAAEAIMRKAEELATNNFLKKEEPPSSYTYTKSIVSRCKNIPIEIVWTLSIPPWELASFYYHTKYIINK